jgi:hypothetical protein
MMTPYSIAKSMKKDKGLNGYEFSDKSENVDAMAIIQKL